MPSPNLLKVKVSLKGRPIGMHTFNKDVITVGRDPGSDIHLDNVNVSREHLRFEFGPSGYYTLVDLGSANGTFLNDEAVSRGYVYNNDVVRIGKYALWIGFEADRRTLDAEPARVSPDKLAGTTVLSSNDLDKMLSASREVDKQQSLGLDETDEGAGKAARPVLSLNQTRLAITAGIVAAFIVGTAVGAGAAWLMLRP